LGTAREDLCDDTREVRVQRYRRVDPDFALVAEGYPHAFVAEGYPLDLATHPLHKELTGPPAAVEALRTGRCDRPVSWKIRFDSTPPEMLFRRAGEREQAVMAFLPHAKIRGFSRGGVPYFRRGDRVIVRLRRCRFKQRRPLFVASRAERP
jgi:hypothetical protein